MMLTASTAQHALKQSEVGGTPMTAPEMGTDGDHGIAFATLFATEAEAAVSEAIHTSPPVDLEQAAAEPDAETDPDMMLMQRDAQIETALRKTPNQQGDKSYETGSDIGRASDPQNRLERAASLLPHSFDPARNQLAGAHLNGEALRQANPASPIVGQDVMHVETRGAGGLGKVAADAIETDQRGVAPTEGVSVVDKSLWKMEKSSDHPHGIGSVRDADRTLVGGSSGVSVMQNETKAAPNSGESGAKFKIDRLAEVSSDASHKAASKGEPQQSPIASAGGEAKLQSSNQAADRNKELGPQRAIGIQDSQSTFPRVDVAPATVASSEKIDFHTLPAATSALPRETVAGFSDHRYDRQLSDQVHAPRAGEKLPVGPLKVTSRDAVALAEPQIHMDLKPQDLRHEFISHGMIAPFTQAEANRSFGQVATQIAPTLSAERAVMIVRDAVDALANSKQREIELQLHPKELGKLRFVMSPGEGQMLVQVFAERPETLEALRRHGEILTQELFAEGFENASFTFEQETSQGRDVILSFAEEQVQEEQSGTSKNVAGYEWRSPDGRLDIRI